MSSTEEESVRMSIEGLDLILFGKKMNERNSPHPLSLVLLFPTLTLYLSSIGQLVKRHAN